MDKHDGHDGLTSKDAPAIAANNRGAEIKTGFGKPQYSDASPFIKSGAEVEALPLIRAIRNEAIARANANSKAEFGESIWARALRDWAASKGLDLPPERWPCELRRVGSNRLLWQLLDWAERPIGEPWRFKRAPTDCFALDFSKDDPIDYFGSLGAVLDATVDPQRYAAILMRLPPDPHHPTR
jgi:hypothetical protein